MGGAASPGDQMLIADLRKSVDRLKTENSTLKVM